jgi:hypothetical protein
VGQQGPFAVSELVKRTRARHLPRGERLIAAEPLNAAHADGMCAE